MIRNRLQFGIDRVAPEKPDILTGLLCQIFRKLFTGDSIMKKRTRHPLWAVWHGMWRRCTNPNRSDYKHYGGRGISVCMEWKSLLAFAVDMGARPTKSHTLDRIDNNGNYTPQNCRWATKQEQQANSRVALKITARGKTQSLSAWARELGMSVSGLHRRWHTHGTIEAGGQ